VQSSKYRASAARSRTTSATHTQSFSQKGRRRARTVVLNAAICAALGGAFAGAAGAADRIWDGGGANDLWSNPLNWDGDLTAPVSGDTLTFDGALRPTPANNLAPDSVFGPITFTSAAGPFVIGGSNRITLGGDVINNSSSIETINLAMLLNGNRSVNVANGAVTLGGVISGAAVGITKSGTGILTLGATNTYTGSTTIDGGTLAYTADNTATAAINFGAAPTAAATSANIGTLDLTAAKLTTSNFTVQTNSATPNQITIGAGKTLTINGPFTMGVGLVYSDVNGGANTALNVSGNSLVVNSGTNNLLIGVGRNNASPGADPVATMDLSAGAGLNNFSYTATTGQLQVGGGNLRSTLTLANVSNTITVATINVGNSNVNGPGNNNGGRSIMHLGAGSNVLNANTILLGEGKSGGILDFAASAASGTVTITGQAGGTSVANIQIGSSSSVTGSNDDSELLLAGHSVNIQAGNVVVGRLAGGTGGNSARGITTFDTGTFAISSLQLGVNSSGTTAANGATGTFTLGGPNAGNTAATGVLTVSNQFYLANRTNTNVTTAGRSTGAFIINGGTANITTDILDASTTVTTLAGATGGPNQTTLTLDGGTLNMNGRSIGTFAAPITTINLNSGTFNGAATIAGRTINVQSAVVVNGAPNYVIADGGVLTSGAPVLTLASGAAIGGGGATGANVSSSVLAATGSRISPGFGSAAGTLTFNNDLTLGANSTLAFKLGAVTTVGGGINDLLNVNGALSFNGTAVVSISGTGGGPVPGTYRLINYVNPTTAISGTNLVVFGQTRQTFTLDTATAGQVNVTVGAGTAPLALTWTAGSGTKWNLATDFNWRNPTPAPDRFFAQDSVTFDDTATNPSTVELVGALAPASLTVNAARDYTFGGAGSITGSTALTKSGTGTLVLANTGVNDYGGGTIINTGSTLQVGAGGSGAGNLPSGGAVANNGSLVLKRSDAFTVNNVISGAGDVKILGGTVTLTGASTYTGPTTITNGATVKVGVATGPAGGASSLGAVPGGAVTIYSGSTLDLTPNATANTTNFGQKQFFIEGTGVGGLGAIVNNSAVAQQLAFERITLTNDATIGGTQRYDMRETNGVNISSLDLQGHTLTKIGANQFSLVAVNVSESGNIVVNAGTFSVESTTVMGGTNSVTFNDGTTAQFFSNTATASLVTRPMVFNGAVRTGTGSNNNNTIVGSNILLNGNVTVAAISNNVTSLFTLTGVISETGGARTLTKTGNSLLFLNGANTYSGVTTISGGVASAAILGNGGIAGGIGISSSSATNVLLAGGALGYSGTVPTSTDRQFTVGPVTGGLDASGAAGAPVNFTSTAPITIGGAGAVTFTLAGSNADNNVLAAKIVDGTAATGVTKSGAGAWTLANSANSYTGPTTLNAGILRVNVLANGGTASGIGQASSAPANLVLGGGTLSFTGAVAASTDRQLTLVGAGGGLDASGAAGAPVNFSNTGAIVNNGTALAAVLTLGGSNSDANVFAGQIVQPATGQPSALTKIGAGTWVVSSAAHTYTGATTVSGGTLRVTGSIATSSGVTVNDPTATFEAAATQRIKGLAVTAGLARIVSASGKIALTVGDASFGASGLSLTGGKLDLTTNGVVVDYADSDATGDAAVAASVRAQVLAGFNGGDWKGTTGITSSSIGSLTAVGYALAGDVLPFANGATTDTFLGTTVDKSAVVARYTLSGDINLDGTVDFLDLARLAQSYNVTDGTRQWSTGDVNYDGNTDFLDLAKMAQNYNTALPSAAIPSASAGFDSDLARAFAAVPEPGAIGLFSLCGALLMTRRCRRTSVSSAAVSTKSRLFHQGRIK
jgi:fibronectin-binding autotransporter adhesin